MIKDDLGERIKGYEKKFTSIKLSKDLPVLVRLDGKAFHSYTKGLEKPFSRPLLNAFENTVEHLHKYIHFDLAYHQSDEITLAFLPKLENSELIFGGKVSKINSVLSSMTSVLFNREMENETSKLAFFDCRCFNVPDLDEATCAVFWRMQDAIRNSVSMLAQANFSHKELHKKSCQEMKQMLDGKWESLPISLRQGSLWRNSLVKETLDAADLESLPPKHDLRKNPEAMFIRSRFAKRQITSLVSEMTHEERKTLFFL